MALGWYVVKQPSQGGIYGNLKAALASFYGMMPTIGSTAVALKAPAVAMSGSHPYTGTVAAGIRAALVSMSGEQSILATAIPSMKPLSVDFNQGYAGGTVLVGMPKAIASFVASQSQAGTVVAAIPAPVANFAGQNYTNPAGTFAAEIKRIAVSMSGEQRVLSTLSAALKAAVAAFAGQHSQGGTIASSMKAATFAASQKIYISYTWVASTKPAEIIDWGQGSYLVDANGLARDGATPSNTNGTYLSGGVHQSPLGSVLHSGTVTRGNNAGQSDRGSGAAVGGSDANFTNGVFVIATGTGGWRIYSKVGTVYTSRANGTNNSADNNDIKLEITYNGTNYVYTYYKAGVSIGSWSDTTAIITPGLYGGMAFSRIYSGGQFGGPGVKGSIILADT